jgi:hypothetical protein
MAKIVTNRAWREFRPREDVPPAILASEFDWTNEAHAAHGDYSDGFILYRGTWYHVGMFMRGGPEGWDASHGDSFFSGIVIRVSRDGERYQIGTYYA